MGEQWLEQIDDLIILGLKAEISIRDELQGRRLLKKMGPEHFREEE
jgi:hypothetical protein